MNDKIMISPNCDVNSLIYPIKIETYIDLYEDRIIFWIIEPAKILSKYKHGGIAVLYLLASYFESYSIFINGIDSDGQSRSFFEQGFLSVFTDITKLKYTKEQITQIIDIMYKKFRCGLYHSGLPKERIMLCNSSHALNFQINSEKKSTTFRLILTS